MENKKPLDGICVIELGTHVCVPTCTRLLADWGAQVIKVESPAGDAYRATGIRASLPCTDDCNVLIQHTNANKEGISINLKDPDGKEIMLRLLAKADVFVTNTRLKALEKLGFGYEELRAKFPKLVMAHFSGFGNDGPDKNRPGFDTAAFWARGGAVMEWTLNGAVPFKPYFGFGDSACASTLALGIMCALFKRERTGEGEFLTQSLYGTALWYNYHGVLRGQSEICTAKVPSGRYDEPNPLYPLHQTSDGYWLSITEPNWWTKYPLYLSFLGLDEYVNDPRVVDEKVARQDMSFSIDLIAPAFKQHTFEECTSFLISIDTVHEKLAMPQDLYQDEQAWSNGYLSEYSFSNGTTAVFPTPPVQFQSFSYSGMKPAPRLGENTLSILKNLGYTNEEQVRLCSAGIVKTAK